MSGGDFPCDSLKVPGSAGRHSVHACAKTEAKISLRPGVGGEILRTTNLMATSVLDNTGQCMTPDGSRKLMTLSSRGGNLKFRVLPYCPGVPIWRHSELEVPPVVNHSL